MPVQPAGTRASCVSKPDAWDLLSRLATSGQLARFRGSRSKSSAQLTRR